MGILKLTPGVPTAVPRGKYTLPAYCEDGKYDPAVMMVSDQPSPPAAVTVN